MLKIVNGIIPIIISTILSASALLPNVTPVPFDEKIKVDYLGISNNTEESKDYPWRLKNGTFFTDCTESKKSYIFTPEESGSYVIIIYRSKNMSVDLYDNDNNKKIMEGTSNSYSSQIKLASTLIAGKNYYININPTEVDTSKKEKNEYTILVHQVKEPIDSDFKMQWALLNKDTGVDINILPVWQYTKGKNIKIGVADTGMYFLHNDLDDNFDSELSYNFIHEMQNVYPEDEADTGSAAKMGHGTIMAGIIGAELNNKGDGKDGIVGVAPGCKIVSLKVMGSKIPDHPVQNKSVAAFIKAVEYAKANNIKIINCSLGGKLPSTAEKEAMANAKDILFVLSAGNNGEDLEKSPIYPACYCNENSIVVAAMTKEGELLEYSNYGGPTDIMAPGAEIISTYPEDRYFEDLIGSSMATPFVTAVCGLILSQHKDLSPIEIKERVTGINNVTSVEGLEGKIKSKGFLNAFKAVICPDIEDGARKVHSMGGVLFNQDVKSQIKYYKDISENANKTNAIIVKFKPGIDVEECLGQVSLKHEMGKIIEISYLKLIDAYLLNFSSVEEADASVDLLNSFDDIKYAEPDYVRQ